MTDMALARAAIAVGLAGIACISACFGGAADTERAQLRLERDALMAAR